MTEKSKNFFQNYWQAILIAVTINVIVGILTNVGAYKVVLYKLEENIKQERNCHHETDKTSKSCTVL